MLCVLLPPVLYLLTVSFMETYLQKKYDKEVNNVYLSDMNDILNGLTSVKTSIRMFRLKRVYRQLLAVRLLVLCQKTRSRGWQAS